MALRSWSLVARERARRLHEFRSDGGVNGSLGVVGSEWSYAVSADLVRSYLRPTPAVDPTIPGIPQDALDHAANVERARSHIKRFHGLAFLDEIGALAEALTTAELRGWAKGVESVKAAVGARQCRSCAYDTIIGSCAQLGDTDGVLTWCAKQTWTRSADGTHPSPDADNCPGWAPKETP